MAATWRALGSTILFAARRSMLDIYNAAGSVQLVKLYRMWLWNNTTSSVSGGVGIMAIRRTTTASGGVTITPVAHDTTSPSLDSNITVGTDRIVTATQTFRRFPWLIEEATSTGSSNAQNWQCLVSSTEVWNLGYGDTTVEPIFCRVGYGVDLCQVTNLAGHSNDVELEFVVI